MSESTEPQRRRWLIPVAVGVGVLVLAAIVWSILPRGEVTATSTPSSTATLSPTPTQTPTPTPTVVGAPENGRDYGAAALPILDVFTVNGALLVDDAPTQPVADLRATPGGAGAPVFADPYGDPVAFLPQTLRFGGTTVPVIQRDTFWVKVLLPGRQGTPPSGNPAQAAGWLRLADVVLAPVDARVEVSISARTIEIVTGDQRELVASDFGWGAPSTPTPIGRTFIMHTEVVPEYGYTRGHPLVYLGVQSPTLAGFSGADVAVTAFHYHDNRSGPISNGCLRLDGAAIDRLAQLPMGTPVSIIG